MAGHETSRPATPIYLHVDLAPEQRALAPNDAPNTKSGQYRPPPLLAFLEHL